MRAPRAIRQAAAGKSAVPTFTRFYEEPKKSFFLHIKDYQAVQTGRRLTCNLTSKATDFLLIQCLK